MKRGSWCLRARCSVVFWLSMLLPLGFSTAYGRCVSRLRLAHQKRYTAYWQRRFRRWRIRKGLLP